jgi:hypothetical protein
MLASQASVCVDAITVCPPKEREVAGSNPAQSTILYRQQCSAILRTDLGNS